MSVRLERWAAACGVALAAIATLATSPMRWNLDDAKRGKFVLDDANPRGSVSVTIHATQPPEIDVDTTVRWAAKSTGAEVKIAARSKDGLSPIAGRAARMFDGGATLPETHVETRLAAPSCASGCSAGYEIVFERIGGSGERVELAWTIRGVVRGTGEAPKGAGVAVKIDSVSP